MNILTRIKTSFFAEYPRWILWTPIIFACGIMFYFSFPNNFYLFPLALFFSSLILIFVFRNNLWRLLITALAIFLFGFLWTKFYTETISYTPKIEYKFYATAIGKVDNIDSFYNPFLKRNAHQIVLKDLAIYKAGSIEDDAWVKKEKPKKIKKIKKKKVKKKTPKKNKSSQHHKPSGLPRHDVPRNDDVENLTSSLREGNADVAIQKTYDIEPKKKRTTKPQDPKPKKITKTIIKNYLNLKGYQEIDRKFLSVDYASQNKNWFENRYLNPPKKVILNINTKMNDVKIGDTIQTRVILEPFAKPYIEGGYDKSFDNYFKGIGGTGFAASDLKLLKTRNENSFLQDIKILRQKIAKKILDQTNRNEGTIAAALLVGGQNLIPPDIMQILRLSGLAHLISISGLHFTLAAGIFFLLVRFLLSLNQYMVLNYDIKKISALIAILAGLFYLFLADTPIPAIRAFIVITLIFIAILLDLKPDAFRSTAFAALAILIFSPNAIFSISFGLSFAAILSLIVLADLTKKYQISSSQRPIYFKFLFYLIGIILSSIAATIATTPFSIYHFNNFISYGVLANLLAIPIASFITMPFGFLSLLLMPFGIEKIALIPMQFSIGWIIDIASYVASIPNSYLTIKSISSLSFGLIIFGGLWLMIWQKRWRLLGTIPIILGIYLGIRTPIPKMLIDEERKLFAFYYNEKLIFIKPTKAKQAIIWSRSIGLNSYYSTQDLSEEEKQNLQLDCSDNFCKFYFDEKRILVLKGRNKLAQICDQNYDVIINLNKKYKTPQCIY